MTLLTARYLLQIIYSDSYEIGIGCGPLLDRVTGKALWTRFHEQLSIDRTRGGIVLGRHLLTFKEEHVSSLLCFSLSDFFPCSKLPSFPLHLTERSRTSGRAVAR